MARRDRAASIPRESAGRLEFAPASPPRPRRPLAQRPGVVGFLGLLCLLAMVLAAAGGAYGYNRSRPQVVTTTTVTVQPPFRMALPVTLVGYTRQGSERTTTSNGRTTTSALYRRDATQAVVALSRTVTDLRGFMEGEGFDSLVAYGDGWCGMLEEISGCGVLRQQTAVVLLGVSNQSRVTLMALDRRVADELAG